MFETRGNEGGLGVCFGDMDLDLDLGLGDGGAEGSGGSKGLGIERRLLNFGDGGWGSEDVEGYEEERVGCL